MKGFIYIFEEGFKHGLRRESSNPRNTQSLVECHNAAPGEAGLEPHEVVTSLDADGVSWGGRGVISE